MPKRQFLPVMVNGLRSRVFMDDILKIYHKIKKARPRIPKYFEDSNQSKSLTRKYEASYEHCSAAIVTNFRVTAANS